jgi:hypothetical protein
MTTTQIRKCDEGTAYAKALMACEVRGVANATDAQVMAMFCETTMQLMVGAFSPRLVWEGAQKAGMTALELHNLCARKNARTRNAKLDDLQWS